MFAPREVSTLCKITHRQVGYWARKGIVSLIWHRGKALACSLPTLLSYFVVSELAKAGTPIQSIRRRQVPQVVDKLMREANLPPSEAVSILVHKMRLDVLLTRSQVYGDVGDYHLIDTGELLRRLQAWSLGGSPCL